MSISARKIRIMALGLLLASIFISADIAYGEEEDTHCRRYPELCTFVLGYVGYGLGGKSDHRHGRWSFVKPNAAVDDASDRADAQQGAAGSANTSTSAGGNSSSRDVRRAFGWVGGYLPLPGLPSPGSTGSGQSLTFIFPDLGLHIDTLGYHWAQDCGDNVVEGGFYQTSLQQPISTPEPLATLPLIFGLLGLAEARRKLEESRR